MIDIIDACFYLPFVQVYFRFRILQFYTESAVHCIGHSVFEFFSFMLNLPFTFRLRIIQF